MEGVLRPGCRLFGCEVGVDTRTLPVMRRDPPTVDRESSPSRDALSSAPSLSQASKVTIDAAYSVAAGELLLGLTLLTAIGQAVWIAAKTSGRPQGQEEA